MPPLDEGFRNRLAIVFREWQEGIAVALRERQAHGRVRGDAEPAETAGFLIAMLEGYVSLAKNAQDAKVWKVGAKHIAEWLRSLRAGQNIEAPRSKLLVTGAMPLPRNSCKQRRLLRQRCRIIEAFVTSGSAQRYLLSRPRVDSMDRLR
jgi:hypothetical protein